jgi:ribose transport system permease protein
MPESVTTNSLATDRREIGMTYVPPSRRRSLTALLGFRNIGTIYVIIIIILVFSFWSPQVFPTLGTVKQVLNTSAITGLAALAVVIPLSARVFDLSFAYTMSLTGCITAYLMTQVSMPAVWAIFIALAASLLVGVVNGIVVVKMKIDSFIGTLATGSLVQAFITMFTNDTILTGSQLSGGFERIAQQTVGGVTLQVIYALILTIVLWYLMEHTPAGRQIYATGFNYDAARLANIRVDRIRSLSLLSSSFIAGIAGIVLAASIGAGSPTAGISYLLPAYAAAFLGATQFKGGRFNALGTIVAVILLGTGSTGLEIAGAPPWASAMFTGVVLIAALSASGFQRRSVKRIIPDTLPEGTEHHPRSST